MTTVNENKTDGTEPRLLKLLEEKLNFNVKITMANDYDDDVALVCKKNKGCSI